MASSFLAMPNHNKIWYVTGRKFTDGIAYHLTRFTPKFLKTPIAKNGMHVGFTKHLQNPIVDNGTYQITSVYYPPTGSQPTPKGTLPFFWNAWDGNSMVRTIIGIPKWWW